MASFYPIDIKMPIFFDYTLFFGAVLVQKAAALCNT